MLDIGTRLGPYEILGPIGAGGMGEVYRAKDTRLDRTVAVKVLPPAFASSPQLRQRFEREARMISQLTHPHICTMHDVGQHEGVDYLVMEYLEGENLSERLAKGPLPVEKAIKHAIEIADALDKAHRQGIVHRDLKPGNIMLTRGGAKLLDFGLAKPAAAAVDGNAATMQKSLTEEGTIIGTFQYMAPEQLEGVNADARTDIFAFGAVLYEMLTGKRAFEGKTRTSVIAAIVEREPPPMSQFQPMTPPALERLVRNCLAKDPDDRWQTAHDVLLGLRALGDANDSGTGIPVAVVAKRRNRERLAWITAVLALLGGAAVGVYAWRVRNAPVEVLRTSIVAPEGTRMSFSVDDAASLTISPDGRYVTFVASVNETSRLWVRRVDQLQAQPLTGTDGATYPFWSPDGKDIAFFANRSVKRIPAAGGAVTTITTDVRDSRGGAWGANGMIVYSHHWRSALSRVSATGGKSTPVTRLDPARSETTHRYPRFLPDGEHFLYLAGSHTADATSAENAIWIGSVRAGVKPKLLLNARSQAIYASGNLLFWREGNLLAQRFNTGKLALEGEPRVVAEGVRYEKGFFRAVFDASSNGTLVYQRGGTQTHSQLVWFGRDGKRLGTVGEPGEIYDVRISPDGLHAAIAIDDPSDLWVYDLRRGVRSRVTSAPYGEQAPVFSPDGKTILYSNDANALFDVMRRSLTTGSAATPLLAERNHNEFAWDWAGGYVVYESENFDQPTQADLWAIPENGGTPIPLVQTPAVDSGARVSPDGKWLAYTSFESGTAEVYVTAFPRPSGKWQISQGGGSVPVWRRDGKELFYGKGDAFFAVPVTATTTIESGTPVLLFSAPVKNLPPPFFDVTPDGQRFLINTLPEKSRDEPITLVRNWDQE
jgi:Tol biopolymer transport system component/predicted Ser/Thr protein kinase